MNGGRAFISYDTADRSERHETISKLRRQSRRVETFAHAQNARFASARSTYRRAPPCKSTAHSETAGERRERARTEPLVKLWQVQQEASLGERERILPDEALPGVPRAARGGEERRGVGHCGDRLRLRLAEGLAAADDEAKEHRIRLCERTRPDA